MQDVTDLPFWRLMAEYGGADLYYTEYFRVHKDSHLEKWIVESLTRNPTGRPAIAQMIGNDIPSLVRTARELQQHAVADIDLNLGCPAPVVYRKCAGGGLLREPARIDSILGALRDAITGRFTVKTRVGFDDPRTFDLLLPIFAKHSLDLLTVHGRTVTDMYRGGSRMDLIAQAAATLPCPVLANGNVNSASQALETLRLTRARGLMIGRGAIANPWLFDQIRLLLSGAPITEATGPEILDYIRRLYDAICSAGVKESAQVQKMKKTMNFIAARADSSGQFLHQIRRVIDKKSFFDICRQYLEKPILLSPTLARYPNYHRKTCTQPQSRRKVSGHFHPSGILPQFPRRRRTGRLRGAPKANLPPEANHDHSKKSRIHPRGTFSGYNYYPHSRCHRHAQLQQGSGKRPHLQMRQ
jgi:tRNA-dihydrouridine synthase